MMDIVKKLNSLKSKEQFIYHTGFLARDISFYDDMDELLPIKNAAWDLYKRGMVELVQRYIGMDKAGFSKFEYIAIGKR